MSNIINKENVYKIIKYFLIFIFILVSIYVSIYLVKAIFVLGNYVGSLMRIMYHSVC